MKQLLTSPLAQLAVMSYEWKTRYVRLSGTTWAGLWHTANRAEVQELIVQHTQVLDSTIARQLLHAGRLPGVRDITHLIALLVDHEEGRNTNTTTNQTTNSEEHPVGIPIFHHGVLDQAKLSDVRHATHLVRHLDDFHEPTIAAIRRRLLRNVADVEQRSIASAQAVDIFLKQPTRWRDVVEMAICMRTIRAIEDACGRTRLPGRRRSLANLAEMVAKGIELLRAVDMKMADQISRTYEDRRANLAAARVVLMYEEHQYLQLTGVMEGRSIRRHLPKGLHLIFSDQIHRRNHRAAGLWLAASDNEHQVGPYYYAPAIPLTYAAKQKRRVFRLPDEATLRRYAEDDLV